MNDKKWTCPYCGVEWPERTDTGQCDYCTGKLGSFTCDFCYRIFETYGDPYHDVAQEHFCLCGECEKNHWEDVKRSLTEKSSRI